MIREVVRGIILDEQGLVLLGKRTGTDRTAAGEWALIGGKVDPAVEQMPPETPLEALHRECREEGAIALSEVTLFKRVEEPPGEGTTWIAYYYACRAVGIPVCNGEHEEIRYFPLDNLPSPIAFGHETILQEYAASPKL